MKTVCSSHSSSAKIQGNSSKNLNISMSRKQWENLPCSIVCHMVPVFINKILQALLNGVHEKKKGEPRYSIDIDMSLTPIYSVSCLITKGLHA